MVKARVNAGLTQGGAAELVYSNLRSWQKWELGERQMHPAFWELFRLKTTTASAK
ncbi:XRE family transcriptional regulator (plasmid) [Xanthomonas oryzae pv. oryzae]|nr:XRE family transcriptional regulator [Xanthomonas oryzae pv. oryzae]